MATSTFRILSLTVAGTVLAVAQIGGLKITVPAAVTLDSGIFGSIAYTISGGAPPYTLAFLNAGALPPGLSIVPGDNVISGTPTQVGTYPVTLTATDAGGNVVSAYLVITVAPPISLPSPSLPPATLGVPYAQQLTATGGAPPYNWALPSGALPPGFRVDAKGIVGGVATATGSYTFTATVTDAQGQSASSSVTIQVVPPPPVIASGGIGNAASPPVGLSPGAYATIAGTNLSQTRASATGVPFADTLGGVTVTVNGVRAPLLFVSPAQINFQVPFGTPIGKATIVVSSQGVASAGTTVDILSAAPGIFQTPEGRALALNQDGTLNDPQHPARAGTIVVLFATGAGRFATDLPTGGIAPLNALVRLAVTPSVTIAGLAAEVIFAGAAPGEGDGTVQLNVRVPALPAGDYPVAITANGVQSNAPLLAVAAAQP